VADKQFTKGYGAIITFRVGSKERAFKIINALKIPNIVSNIGSSYALEQCLSILSPNVSSPRLLRKAFCGERQPPVFLNKQIRQELYLQRQSVIPSLM